MQAEAHINIIESINELIQKVQNNPELLKAIKQRLGGERWRGFGFETLVKDIRKNANIEALKKAKKRLEKNPSDTSNTNYQNLKSLYDDACAKYFGNEILRPIQSISIDARKEAKALGIDWEKELKKLSDTLAFRKPFA